MVSRTRRRKNSIETCPGCGATAPLSASGDADGNPAPRESGEARRRREKFERALAQDLRERDEARRAFFTAFRMWTICPHKACTRASACAGDTEECRRERWRHAVPADLKALISKIAALVSDGYSLDEAHRLAQEDMRQRRALFAAIEVRHGYSSPASPPKPAAPAAQDAPPPGPRIRVL